MGLLQTTLENFKIPTKDIASSIEVTLSVNHYENGPHNGKVDAFVFGNIRSSIIKEVCKLDGIPEADDVAAIIAAATDQDDVVVKRSYGLLPQSCRHHYKYWVSDSDHTSGIHYILPYTTYMMQVSIYSVTIVLKDSYGRT